MSCLARCCDSLTHNRVTIRIVTNLVLAISDTDFVCSLLFAREILLLGGIYDFFFCVMLVGMFTYFAGVCYFAPRQKFKVVKQLKEIMISMPEQFKSTVGGDEQTIGIHSPLGPGYRPPGEPADFDALNDDKAGYKCFKRGLAAWGLSHQWDYAEIRNRLNSFEVKHGMPFFRLARLGFAAAPTPKDLCGVLNANALYTFSTGLFQLCIGANLLYSTAAWTNMFVTVPLGVSSCSLLLSIANMLLDFATVLNQLEVETRLARNIQQRNETDRLAAREQLEQELADTLAQIDADFADQTDAVEVTDKQQKQEEARKRHYMSVQAKEKMLIDVLHQELHMYRSRMAQIQTAMQGQLPKSVFKRAPTFVQAYQDARQPLEDQRRKIEASRNEKIGQLDPISMSAEEYRKQMKEIEQSYDEKLQVVREKLDDVNLQHAGSRVEKR